MRRFAASAFSEKQDTEVNILSETTEKKKKKFPRRLIIPLYLLIIVLLIVIVYALPTVTGALKQTMVVEYGDLKISEKATCYIIKNETLYFANGEGRLKYVFDEGALVRGGSEVLYIEPSEVDNDSDLGRFRRSRAPFHLGQHAAECKERQSTKFWPISGSSTTKMKIYPFGQKSTDISPA